MHGKLSIAVLLRAPVKTAITLLLLIATSFAFISRGAEYATTVAEIDKAEANYSAVGTLERSTEGYYEYMENLLGEEVYELEGGNYVDRQSNASAPLDAEIVELVLNSEYLADSEFFMVAGGTTSDELRNVTEQPLYDVPDYSDWEWYCKSGTFGMGEAWFTIRLDYEDVSDGTVQDVLLGDEPAIWRGGQWLWFGGINTKRTEDSPPVKKEQGDVYLVAASGMNDVGFIVGIYNPYVDYPVINLTQLEEEHGITDVTVALQDPEKYGLTRYEHEYGLPTVSLLDYMETLDRNFHTLELVHLSDMDALHKYHEGDLYISDGRGITEGDGLVCVVSADYAQYNDLRVGDTIEFDMSADTLRHSGKVYGREPTYPAVNAAYYMSSKVEGFATTASEQVLTERGLENVTQTYEIVGIWSDSNYDVADPFSYSPNTVFVPMSTYPWTGEVEPTMLPSTFSFTLNHPSDMAKIEAELGDTLAAMGYELSIDDMGYAEAAPSLEFMKLSALVSFAAMSLALLLSLALVVYLFILRRKQDYAIMRALGMPERQANNTLLIGLMTLSAIAVMLAGLMSLVVTQNFAAELSVQLSEITGVETVTTLPSWLVGVFAAGVLILLTLFARIGLIKVGRTPPLRLLQGGR